MSVKRSVNTSPQTPGAVTKTSRTSIQTINLGHRVVKQVWVSRGMFLLCKRSLVPEIGLFRTNRPIQRRNSPKNVIQPHYITTLSLLWEDGPQFVSRLQRTLFIGKSPPDLRQVNSENGSARNSVKNTTTSCRPACNDPSLYTIGRMGLQIQQDYSRHVLLYQVHRESRRVDSETWRPRKWSIRHGSHHRSIQIILPTLNIERSADCMQ